MYGYDDLKPGIEIDESSVDCPVRSCNRRVARQRKRFLKEFRFRCPEHRITISPSTFEYDREEDNLLCREKDDLALLAKIRRVKRESRIARDNSEDAVTWNVFRTLERAHALGLFAQRLLNDEVGGTPRVSYWTCCPGTFGPWSPLIEAAAGFGERQGRHSEPDIILVYDDLIVFVEAKLGASNVTTPSDPANPKSYMTGHDGWFGRVFREGASFQSVAVEARLYELMRLWLIGTRIAEEAGCRFALVNLVRAGDPREADIEERFGHHILASECREFRRLTWEQINSEILPEIASDSSRTRLSQFFAGKTLGYAGNRIGDREFGLLNRAFQVEA